MERKENMYCIWHKFVFGVSATSLLRAVKQAEEEN